MQPRIAAALTSVLLLACGTPESGPAHVAAEATGEIAGRPRQWVRVARGSTVLAAFSGSRAQVLVDGSHLSIELSSSEGEHRLAIEVDGTAAGVYQLRPSFEPAKAVILLVSRGLPSRLSPGEGEFRLLEMRDGRCSGTFSGRARDRDGLVYAFDGSFVNAPVRRL